MEHPAKMAGVSSAAVAGGGRRAEDPDGREHDGEGRQGGPLARAFGEAGRRLRWFDAALAKDRASLASPARLEEEATRGGFRARATQPAGSRNRDLITSPWEVIPSWLLDRVSSRIAAAALQAIALSCRLRPRLRGILGAGSLAAGADSFNAGLQLTTRDGRSRAWIRFASGKATAGVGQVPGRTDVTIILRDASYLRRFFSLRHPPDLFGWLLDNHMSFEGNLAVLARFGHIATAVRLGGRPQPRPPDRPWPADLGAGKEQAGREDELRPAGRPCRSPAASGARLLPDPALARYTLRDFPRIAAQLNRHLHTRPRVCTERARLWTEAARAERRANRAESPVLRQARVFSHVLRNRRAIIWPDDQLAGTTTSQPVGVIVFPELGGTAIWPELLTVGARELNPYEISEADIAVLDREVFPFWIDDNIREWARSAYGDPRALRLDEKWVLYFLWKNHAVSHTIADMPAVLGRGLASLAREHETRASSEPEPERRAFHQAAAMCLEAVIDYSRRLSAEAEAQAGRYRGDGARRAELRELARICRKVPAGPAASLHEAFAAVWVVFLSLHQESMNAGLSLGRLDTWLQPYFERDAASSGAAAGDERARAELACRALELSCAFMLKATDHLPLVADIGNRLFGGSSSDQVITLGGLRPDGESAVCDMTYVLLKATEMLALRDPNMNARYYPDKNPGYYLERLCEVNAITGATPSLHNDRAVLAALARQGIPDEDARDWGATGCVEPTICGRHMGHTNCMMFSLVAPLELVLHDGLHPLLAERVGPRTGDPRSFASFEELLAAYKRQLGALLDEAVEANDMLGRAHQALHPTPCLSALIGGTLESGRDVIDGGARYNSSGTAMIGLADVVDSLAALKTIVYDDRRCSMEQMLAALAADFSCHEALHAQLVHRAPKFGSADPLPARLAADIVELVFEMLQQRTNYRGGRYLPGYWSMSNHVAFGLLSGALPSGRRRGQPFTPGLTPSPLAQTSLLDNMRQIAALIAEQLPNNIAFNVKLAPGGSDRREDLVARMAAYARSYFELGGMQLQFNVVSSQTLREAMANPDAYRSLLVRISGYNAYFVELNRPMQLELIARVEHR